MTDAAVAALRAAGCVFAEDEAALLRAEAEDDRHLQLLLAERVAGRPLEQVLGWAELDGVRVRMSPGVFVPRRRSTLLVRLASAELRTGRETVVDLCCGSGTLGAVLLARHPDLDLHAADLDPAATACARSNLPPERVHEGDLFDALPTDLAGRVDVLVVNAPYVPSGAIATMPPEARDHEHHVALDGGADGLDVQRRVIASAPCWLAPGGLLVVETGPAQAATTAALMQTAGLEPRQHRARDVDGCATSGRQV
ncbi:putative protein N(5)-glutamine methyltransferase [Nocardioides sp.]|uniref:putative protein N(5)-glutamine methyltransferase n=1 Tax=Nocardioides sp. TaxID=35761 RepID=UPI00286C8E58|nr:putative protein N(5)-glutamine methyltransferase [Nocardioides sp.]